MLIQLKDINKVYHTGKLDVKVLNDINLTIDNGEYIAIMGPSGSGKTTLMNIIGCLDHLTSGEYLLEDQNIATLDENQMAKIRNEKIGFVFQQFNLLPKLTAVENVALPLLYQGVAKKERLERAKQALIDVGLEDRISFRPNQLSGGQSQRVAIARAMVTKPQLLLADEPTGALDSVSGIQVMELFKEINETQKTTVLVITHAKEVAQEAKKIFTIFDGVLDTESEVTL
ncbi:MAG TPA: ABC transporter ATP-binding protein [Erysipelothrix sp.]|jgi:putative ABC transport system ATP-binding protein|nr:ABC transporter ATP-binding protein [Erysipelothrix sp.]